MGARQRVEELENFRSDPLKTVCLVSLRAGAYGLNLTCASQCVILDPFWNPFVEDQAIDRIHRIGQVKPVKVHRIVIAETVEDRILALQEKVPTPRHLFIGDVVDVCRNEILLRELWRKMRQRRLRGYRLEICCFCLALVARRFSSFINIWHSLWSEALLFSNSSIIHLH
jgi:superfamily II DNA or RNA helicase